MRSSLNFLLGLGLSTLSTAIPLTSRQDTITAVSKLLIGGGPSGSVLAADFDGTTFKIVANNTIAGSSASWLLFKEGTNRLYAVDESSNSTRLFTFDPATNALSLIQNATGSSGVVFLDFTADGNNMLGTSFGQGTIDIWDIAPASGLLSLRSQLASSDPLGPNAARQDAPHPHQCLLDTSGRFFVCPDLGTDTLLVIDTATFEITNRVRVQPPGCGPRHGVFFPPIPPGGAPAEATHYFLVCEVLSLAVVFELDYSSSGGAIQFAQVQTLSTFGEALPPANASAATAGEIQVSVDGRDVYVSNRLTGNATDSISHFGVVVGEGTAAGDVSLAFRDAVGCGGLVPRMFSLALGAERFVFVANQGGELGLVAFRRNADGSLDPAPAASLPVGVFGADGFGPQFVQQIQ
ncbi:Carboxy-cis,cis-muconate cyclase [Coniochaeta hoffmannii]|uniref:Carboxy-cis,cis-muconate cyclase n=1 Tax=Coniochaeta hoffmannii TaxID=91930 RepID=A0AA38VTI1_9PEZI|nr:Carboxy-cis,cis-muconate cyclase [Coniochaeta hoffmannii]